jgi:penicillin-binding protein 1A
VSDDKPGPDPSEPRPEPPSGELSFGNGSGRPGEETFRADRPRRRRGSIWLWILAVLAVLLAVAAMSAALGVRYVQQTYLQDLPDLPARELLYAVNKAPGIRFLDRNGVLIAERGPKYGDRVTLAQLPAYVPHAFLAAEDRRFYKHGAVDPWAIARAWRANHRAGHVVEGGSTLSQQITKGLFLTPNQTIKRKVQEAVLAWRLEQILTKDEVLELYLNRIFFGANTFGVDGASRTYFGKPASQLTLAESALLAALPKAPSRLALTHSMDAALVRAHLVLDRMEGEGWITPAQHQAALAERPVLSPAALAGDGDMGYALDYATNEVLRLVGPNSPDVTVRLTIDAKLQAAGAAIVRRVVQSQGRAARASQGAMLALGPDGAIRTMVGGVDYGDSVFNRAVQAKRQPGSSFKPIVYAAALEKGLLPSDVRVDEPVEIGDWKPQNYGGGNRGPVTLQTALALSINTVAVKVAQEVGGPAIGELARRFGITTVPPNPDLSVALGAYEVPLIEMVSAFQVFQLQGDRVTPYMVEEVTDVAGHRLFTHQASAPVPVYDITRDSMMVRMLQTVIASGTGTAANFGRPAAGKTGTSQNWRDAWFIGFTPDYVAGVWVGNDDDKPMDRVTGGVLSAQIWKGFMTVAHEGLPVRDFDWLLPDVQPQMEADPRNDFYDGLASDFNAAARSAEEALTPRIEAPPEPAKPQPSDAPF